MDARTAVLSIVCFVVVTFVTGCKDNSGGRIAPPENSSVLCQPPDPGQLDLPPPGELIRLASLTDRDRVLLGSEYDQLLPSNLVCDSGNCASFTPDWPESSGQGTEGLSYGTYVFSLQGLSMPEVELKWDGPVPLPGECHIAMGNFRFERWQWFAADPGEPLMLFSFLDCLNDEGKAIMVVALTGETQRDLAWIRWGGANVPPYPDLQADPESGYCPLTVNFDAGSSIDYDGDITDIEWDLDDNGVFNESGDEENARGSTNLAVFWDTAGEYPVHVRVTDDEGAQSTATTTPELAWQWNRILLGEGSITGLSLAIINGNPAVSFHGYPTPAGDDKLLWKLCYLRSTTPSGENPEDWSQYVEIKELEPAHLKYPGDTSLCLVAGCPAIVYRMRDPADTTWRLYYTRANSSSGGSAEDWTTDIRIEPGISGGQGSLAIVAGTPAIAYQSYDHEELRFARSDTPTGSYESDWRYTLVEHEESRATGGQPSLAVVNGKPAIAFRYQWDDMAYAWSETVTGSTFGDWHVVEFTPPFEGDLNKKVVRPDLIEAAGNPAICFTMHPELYVDYPVYIRSATASGASADDWTQFISFQDWSMDNENGVNPSIGLIGGKPVFVYTANAPNKLFFAESSTSTGDSISDWVVTGVQHHEAHWVYDSLIDLVVHNDNPMAAVNQSGKLFFAYRP